MNWPLLNDIQHINTVLRTVSQWTTPLYEPTCLPHPPTRKNPETSGVVHRNHSVCAHPGYPRHITPWPVRCQPRSWTRPRAPQRAQALICFLFFFSVSFIGCVSHITVDIFRTENSDLAAPQCTSCPVPFSSPWYMCFLVCFGGSAAGVQTVIPLHFGSLICACACILPLADADASERKC